MKHLPIIIVALLLASCATPTQPPLEVQVAQATAEARAGLDATRQAEAVTAAAEAREAARVAAEATRAYQSEADALAFEATRQHLGIVAGQATAAAVQTADAHALVVANAAANRQMAIAQQQANQQREQAWLIASIAIASVLVLGLVAAGGVVLLTRRQTHLMQVKAAAGIVPEPELPRLSISAPPPPRPVRSSPALLTSGQRPYQLAWSKFLEAGGQRQIPIGLDMERGQPVIYDIARDSHLLVNGRTNSGKSTWMRVLANGLLAMPDTAVVYVNGKGNDINSLVGWPNFTPYLCGENERDVLPALVGLLEAINDERLRRDDILARYNVANWYQLPLNANQGPSLALIIDEIASLFDETQMARVRADRHERREIDLMIANFWHGLQRIGDMARKHGITFYIGGNDFTNRRVGPDAKNVIAQLRKVVLPADEHQQIISNVDTSAYEAGRFAYRLARSKGDKALGFNPSQRDLARFHERYAQNGRSVMLPDGILDAIQTGPNQYAIAPPSTSIPLAEQHAAKLLSRLADCTSRTAAARVIFDRSGNPGNTDIQAADAALQWIVDNGRDIDGVAARLLG